jgi:hypothetical protein
MLLESQLRKELWYGPADPDPYQNVTDPEDWLRGYGMINPIKSFTIRTWIWIWVLSYDFCKPNKKQCYIKIFQRSNDNYYLFLLE